MRRRSSLLLASALAVLGFLLVTTASSARANRRAEEPRKAALIHQIVDRRSAVDDLDQAVRQLRAQVLAAQRADARRSRSARDDAERTALLAAQAGTTELKGSALVVHLSDSDRQPSSATADASALKIHDSDLQLVVNALFASGAEAVAVNDSRIVATTPIRAAGDTIVVNFRPLNPPYRVVAIGADSGRFDQSDIVKRFHRWTKLFGLGFSVSHSSGATVPAYTGQEPIDDAKPTLGTGLSMAAMIGLLAGAIVALLLRPSVPADLARYVAMAVVAAIDTSFGGVRTYLERTFNDRIFVIAFVSNAALAIGMVWVGDQLGVDLTTAIVVVFGVRIFQNLAAIRRRVFGG